MTPVSGETDLLKRLRDHPPCEDTQAEAADEIERLRGENARMYAALLVSLDAMNSAPVEVFTINTARWNALLAMLNRPHPHSR